MKKVTKYQGRIRRMVIKAMSATCLVCLFYVPMTMRNETESVGCYKVVMNGQELGSVNSPEDAKEAYYNARKQLSLDNEEVVYAGTGYEVYEEERLFGARVSVADMQELMYDNLAANVVDVDSKNAYTVRINDFSVTLGSKEEVIELIERVKSPYDNNNEFQVAIVSSDEKKEYSIELSKSGFAGRDSELVAMSAGGSSVNQTETAADDGLGISSVDFCQDIAISTTKASESNILTVDEAYAEVTKTTASKTYYTVVAGDGLSAIARKNSLSLEELLALNPGMTVNSLICPGDKLVVTVPTPELSVKVVERVTLEESYYAAVEYRDNSSMYVGNYKVLREAVPGTRTVIADISYVDGVEASREIIEESISKEAVGQIIERGTKVPPTYIKPLNGGGISYTFGWHGSSFHKGCDWYCSTGTPIKACANGTVIRASWYNGYGNCVDIRHDNGVVTRYAHLSGYNCSVGQRVSQGSVIAYSGATGNVTGPHVHLEFIINGTLVDPLGYVSR